jgi:hypothetical protein
MTVFQECFKVPELPVYLYFLSFILEFKDEKVDSVKVLVEIESEITAVGSERGEVSSRSLI